MTIYHFTSIDSFFKIISSGRIFISNLKNSNDPSEGKYQLEAMRNELRKYNRNFSLFYQNTMHNDDLSMYCLSFSSYLNNIHNWMEYGQYGEGIAIGFDYKKLLNKLKRENLSFLEVQKVVYSKQKLKKIIEEVIVDDKNDEVDLGLIQKLLMIYVAFKHDAYSIEKEYRIK